MTQPKLNSRLWLILSLLCAVQFMTVLDFSIVNVALPAIQRDLGFSPQNLQWIVSAYSLMLGGFLLLGGRAADLFGRRRVFMLGLGLFTIASLVAGLAQTQWVLIAARATQGLGAAIVSPAALSTLTTTFAQGKERNLVLSVWGAISAGGFAVGVLLGGLLTDAVGWRWVMFVNVPIGLLVLVLSPKLLPESQDSRTKSQIDLPGAVTITTGLIALVYALEQSSSVGGKTIQTLGLFGAGIVLLISFVFIEARSKAPLIPLRVFRNRTVVGANLIGMMMGASIGSAVFILTLYMQQVLNYSALQTGLAFLPHAIAAIVAAPVASLLTTRFGIQVTLASSTTLAAVGLMHLSRIPVQGSFVRDLLPGTIIIGLGIVMSLVAVTIAATGSLNDREQGMASGLLNTSQQIGAALGLAILVATATARTEAVLAGASASAKTAAVTAGFRAALLVGAGFALAGLLVALLVIRKGEHRTSENSQQIE